MQSPLTRRRLLEEHPHRTLSLLFPSSWMAPRNPHAFAVEIDAEAWFRQLGVIHDAQTAARFAGMAVSYYGGLPFPLADRSGLELATRFLALWLLHDDLIEGTGERSGSLITAALAGELATCADASPCVLAWCELGRTMSARMGAAWSRRLSLRFGDWLSTLEEEARLAARLRQGQTPTAAEYLAVRTTNIGVFPTLLFIELCTGVEVSAQLCAHPAFQTIELLAAGLITIANDLYAFTKDRESDWPNLVTSLAAEHNLPLHEAFHKAGALHRSWLAELLCAEEDLLAGAADEVGVRRWLRGVHHIICGLTRWHECAPRYRSMQTLPDGHSIELAIFPPG